LGAFFRGKTWARTKVGLHDERSADSHPPRHAAISAPAEFENVANADDESETDETAVEREAPSVAVAERTEVREPCEHEVYASTIPFQRDRAGVEVDRRASAKRR